MGSCFLLLLFTPLESNQLTHVLIPGWGGGGGKERDARRDARDARRLVEV